MASLRELRRRIKSVQNIHGITKAMEIISAVRYKKIDTRFKKAMPYFEALQTLVSRIISGVDTSEMPLFEKREVKRELLIVVTGDRGLCGSFNSTILKELQSYLAANRDRKIELFTIGKVGYNFAKKKGLPLVDHWIGIGYAFSSESLNERIEKLMKDFVDGQYDKINVLCMSITRGGTQFKVLEPFLDLSYLAEKKKEDEKSKTRLEYIFEPDAKGVLTALVLMYIRQKFFSILLRSVTAEYFARMVAMKQATDNGKEMIDSLKLARNKVRQAMITKELSEIIGGSNALN